MSVIDKKTFEVFSEITIPEVEKRSFECDDLIAPVISVLNQKGYKTKFCCCGHPYPELTEMYVLLYEGSDDGISSVLGAFKSYSSVLDEARFYKEVSLEDIPEEHTFEPEEIDNTREYKVYYVETDNLFYGSTAYISFAKNYFSEDDLPIGWELQEEEYFDESFAPEDEGSIIQYYFNHEQDVYYFFAQQVGVFMDLYNWAKSLPAINKI